MLQPAWTSDFVIPEFLDLGWGEGRSDDVGDERFSIEVRHVQTAVQRDHLDELWQALVGTCVSIDLRW